MHIVVAQNGQEVKREATSHPSALKGRPLYPRHEWTGFYRPFL